MKKEQEVIWVKASQVSELLNETPWLFKGVTFLKKDGKLRNMNFRQGVKKGVKGTGRHKLVPGLRTVYDTKIDEFRSFYDHKVLSVRQNGKVYEVMDD